jgi:photosystem II stability/assembly factor-like uncharacterized protein
MSTARSLGAAALLLLALALHAGPAAAQHYPAGVYQDFQWRMVGPHRGGRTRAVAGVPGKPNVFYVGAVNGGVWKTDDAGRTWQPIFDDQPTQSIGAIAVAPSNPDVVYVGSGEGLYRPDLSVGDGIYRSADGGRSWEHLGLRGGQQIPELVVDPRDPDHLYAAVLGHPYGPSSERGIYRSRDGGRNWQRVLYKDENTGGSAIAIDPQHPDVLYAGLWEARLGPSEDNNEFNGEGGGLYKSTDGGTSWRKITAGLPARLAQLNITIAPSAPNRLFLVAGTTQPGDYSSAAGLGLYRSDDSGEHWVRVTEDPRPALRIGGGDLAVVRVDPTNPDVVYSASLVAVKSLDGGKTWASMRGAPGGDDYQNLWISPQDPQVIALVADQGAIVSVNGGNTWSSWFNQPTAQLYHVGITPGFPYRVCSGQQESGSVCIASRGNDGEITVRDWHPVGVIEYGYVAPDPLDPDVVYGAGRTEVSKFHWSTGQVQDVTPVPVRGASVRADRTQPLLFSPLDPHTLYYAANRLYRSRDGGEHWQVISPDLARPAPGVPVSVGKLRAHDAQRQRGTIYSLAASPLAGDTLWAGTDDGLVWVTRDGGRQWSDVTPPGLAAWSKVTQLEASHFDADTAYASVSRLRVDDLQPFIYRTRDAGKTWQLIVTGLPGDAPVNAVRADPVRRGLLYAATERAVWVSFDDGEQWDSLQANLPHTSMRDLAVHGTDLIVATHGRGFWILDDVSRLRQLAVAQLAEPFLVAPATATRVARSTWSDTPIPPDEPTAANPPDGAVIEYYLPRAATGTVVLEVLDPQGALVRRYASDDPVEPGAEELARQLIPPYWVAGPRSLAKGTGMHRWVWDLRYPAPQVLRRGYPISAVPHATPREPFGPVAVPGNYTVRLTVEGRRLEAPLHLDADPRVRLAPGAFEQQFALATRLATLLSESSKVLLTVRSAEAQLKTLPRTQRAIAVTSAYGKRLAALLESAKEQEAEEPGKAVAAAAPRLLPAVQAAFGNLYAAVTRSDAAPTAAQAQETDSATAAFASLVAEWRTLEAQLPALNTRLRAAGLAEVRPELPPPTDFDSIDVDEE